MPVVVLMRKSTGNRVAEDSTQAPLLVPASSLGCKANVRVLSTSCFSLEQRCVGFGGEVLVGACISEELFAKDVILASERPLDEMRVADLKAELVARSATATGKKGRLQVRLHSLIVAEAATAARKEHEAEAGGEEDEEERGTGENTARGEAEVEEAAAEEVGSESDAWDEAQAPQVLRPCKVNQHKVFPGAKPGSLLNVWVNLSFDYGSKTGGGTRGGSYEASEPLLESAEGRAVLASYLQSNSKKAKGMLKYISSEVEGRLQL